MAIVETPKAAPTFKNILKTNANSEPDLDPKKSNTLNKQSKLKTVEVFLMKEMMSMVNSGKFKSNKSDLNM
jgi:hypothetical protein